ncbi:MAG: type II secretion system protein [Ilumatobacteraceae bacterium]
MRTRRDAGDTLIEILCTIMIIGLTVGALLSSLGTVGRAGNAQRNSVRADSILRSYAEATKAGVKSCVQAVPPATYTVAYTPPAGYSPTVLPTGNMCPAPDAPRLLKLNVSGPLGLQASMQIKVGAP